MSHTIFRKATVGSNGGAVHLAAYSGPFGAFQQNPNGIKRFEVKTFTMYQLHANDTIWVADADEMDCVVKQHVLIIVQDRNDSKTTYIAETAMEINISWVLSSPEEDPS